MVRSFQIAVILLLAASSGRVGAELPFTWDQRPRTGRCLPSMAAGCPPEGRTAWCAVDFRLDHDVVIEEVTTWYAPDSPLEGARNAWLWIGPKTGPTPNPTDRPERRGRRVAIRIDGRSDRTAVTARDLGIRLGPGDYWLVLTPILETPTTVAPLAMPTAETRGGAAVVWEGCDTGRWHAAPGGLDLSFTLRGRLLDQANAEVFAPFRFPRRMR